MENQKEEFLRLGKTLFSLKMDEKFNGITPFFAKNRPNLDFLELVKKFSLKPTYYSTFLNRREHSFLLTLNFLMDKTIDLVKNGKIISKDAQ